MPTKSSSLVSVLMPFYQEASFCHDAIASVVRQSHTNWELIIVDDCSNKKPRSDLVSIVEKIGDKRVRMLRHDTNRGTAASRNTASRDAKGEFLLPLDSDDMLDSRYMEKTLRHMDGGTSAVYTDIEAFGDTAFLHKPEIELVKVMAGTMAPNTMLFRRSLFDAINGYSEHLPYGEDRDLIIRALSKGFAFKHLAQPLYKYRKHVNGKSRRDKEVRFVMQFREHRELYLSMLEEVLSERERLHARRVRQKEELQKKVSILEEELRCFKANKEAPRTNGSRGSVLVRLAKDLLLKNIR